MPVSKCGKCSFTTRGGIKAIGAHYRKKHPAAMKRRRSKLDRIAPLHSSYSYCPHCGGKL